MKTLLQQVPKESLKAATREELLVLREHILEILKQRFDEGSSSTGDWNEDREKALKEDSKSSKASLDESPPLENSEGNVAQTKSDKSGDGSNLRSNLAYGASMNGSEYYPPDQEYWDRFSLPPPPADFHGPEFWPHRPSPPHHYFHRRRRHCHGGGRGRWKMWQRYYDYYYHQQSLEQQESLDSQRSANEHTTPPIPQGNLYPDQRQLKDREVEQYYSQYKQNDYFRPPEETQSLKRQRMDLEFPEESGIGYSDNFDKKFDERTTISQLLFQPEKLGHSESKESPQQ